jgi:hypothetical protein
VTRLRVVGIAVALAAVAAIGAVTAQHGLWLPGVAARPPVCEVERDHDLGTVEFGQVIPVPIVVTNAGQVPLQVGRPRLSCGQCLSVTLARPDGTTTPLPEVTTIEPGGRVVLTATVQCTGETSETKSVQMLFPTNAPDTPEVSVAVRFRVAKRFYTLPNGIDGGSVPVGRRWRAEATVMGPADWPEDMPPQVTCKDPHIQVTYAAGRKPAEPGRTEAAIGRLHLIREAIPPGANVASVVLTFAGRGPPYALAVPVRLRGVAAVEAIPAEVHLPLATSTGPVYRSRVVIRSADQSPFTARFEAPPGVTVGCAAADAPTAVKVAELTADPKTAGPTAHVQVVCKLGDGECVIPVTVHVAR